MEIDAVVEEGGVLHVPFPAGTPVRVMPRKLVDYTREEWRAFVREVTGSMPDLEVPKRSPSWPVEALDFD